MGRGDQPLRSPRTPLTTSFAQILAFTTLGAALSVHHVSLENPPRSRLIGTGPLLVRDIHRGPPEISGFADSPFVKLNNRLLFAGQGGEIWYTDGTEEGTQVIRSRIGVSFHGETVVESSIFVFPCWFQELGYELCTTDGTTENTQLIADFVPGPESFVRETVPSVAFRGHVFFAAFTPSQGVELWKTDGTNSGTMALKNIAPSDSNSNPHALTVAGDTLLFVASDGVHGNELWRSDGTEFGTALVQDLTPGRDGTGITELVAADRFVYFATAGTNQVWRSDGTSAGTRLLGQFVSSFTPNVAPFGPVPYGPGGLVTLDGRLFFFGNDGIRGQGLWTSDGTPEGTVLVRTLTPALGGTVFLPAPVAGREEVFFAADDGLAGVEPWVSDGTPEGTYSLADIAPGFESSSPQHLAYVNGLLYFAARSSDLDYEPWRSDGTAAGTYRLRDIREGRFGSSPRRFAGIHGKTVFLAVDSIGVAVWITDGTAAGTRRLKRLDSVNASSRPRLLTDLRGTLVFVARESDGYQPERLWRTDGSEAGTGTLGGLYPLLAEYPGNASPSSPKTLTQFMGQLIFADLSDTGERRLWESDGTPDGTTRIATFEPSVFSPHSLTPSADGVFLVVERRDTGLELWQTDSTAEGTRLVKDIFPGVQGSAPRALTMVGSTLFFAARDPEHGEELWRSDGSGAGTVLVKDLRPGLAFSLLRRLTPVGRHLFFCLSDSFNACGELWRSDGTETGTVLVEQLPPRAELYAATGIADLLFFALVEDGVTSLWRSDGSETGTFPLKTFGRSMYGPSDLTPNRATLFFSAGDAPSGVEPWTSDGTVEGTRILRDIAPGPESSRPTSDITSASKSPVSVIDGWLLFAATDPLHGTEVWRSDGTSEGTVLFADLVPGARSSSPSGFVRSGDMIYFAADDRVHAEELWAIPAAALRRPRARPVPFRSPP